MKAEDSFISTLHVARFYLLKPRPQDVYIEDIAYSLSRTPRFSGYTKGEPLSVAEHSLHVSEIIWEQEPDNYALQLAALLHDSAESFLGDIVRPLKATMPDYCKLEARMLRAIFKGLELRQPSAKDWRKIKVADDIMLVTERNAVLNQHGIDWAIDSVAHAVPRPVKIECWPWKKANKNFLSHYQTLRHYTNNG